MTDEAKTMDAEPLTVLSLGAGVQSSTVALMSAAGELPPVDLAVFADTGWEPAAVYAWLDWLETLLPFPVHRVSAGNIRHEQITARARGKKDEQGGRWASLPYYTKAPGDLREGSIRRQCTSEYKIKPINKFLRHEVLGLKPRQKAPKTHTIDHWYGISLDEIQRCKMPFVVPWERNVYPLVERRMTRHDCLNWMERSGYPQPPRSACIGCPFHSNAEWREMRDNRPEEWADAVAFDAAIRKAGGMRADTFLHRDCVPLDEVDLSTPEDHGQLSMLDECEGLCGV